MGVLFAEGWVQRVLLLYCQRGLEICFAYLWLGWSGWQDYTVVWSDCEVSFGRMSPRPFVSLRRGAATGSTFRLCDWGGSAVWRWYVWGSGSAVYKACWNLAQFLRVVLSSGIFSKDTQSSLLSVMRAAIMDYLTCSLCLSFDFSLTSGAKIQQNTSLFSNLQKHSVVAPLVHADVLSSLATKLNLNSSKVNFSLLCPPLYVILSHPRNVVLLLCASVNNVCVRTWRIEAGGCRGFAVMSIREKQNTEKGQSTAARTSPTLNPPLTRLSCWIPGRHDRGTGIGFPLWWWALARWLFLTFNLSGQVGDPCDSCLYCTPYAIWSRENKTNCKQTGTLTFFLLSSVCSKHLFYFASNSPLKTRQASNNQQHS